MGIVKPLAIAAILATAMPAAAQSVDAEDRAEERLVCKKQKKTGTRFTSRTCMTAKAWEEQAERYRREGKSMIDNASAQAKIKQHGEF